MGQQTLQKVLAVFVVILTVAACIWQWITLLLMVIAIINAIREKTAWAWVEVLLAMLGVLTWGRSIFLTIVGFAVAAYDVYKAFKR